MIVKDYIGCPIAKLKTAGNKNRFAFVFVGINLKEGWKRDAVYMSVPDLRALIDACDKMIAKLEAK